MDIVVLFYFNQVNQIEYPFVINCASFFKKRLMTEEDYTLNVLYLNRYGVQILKRSGLPGGGSRMHGSH